MAKKKRYEAQRFETPIKSDTYTRIFDFMLTSEAWKDLNHASRTVYMILKMQYKGNNPTVKCRYKDFQEYGMNTSTVRKCIEDLERHGFIRCERGTVLYHEGNVVLHKTPNEYTFISEWIEWHYE